jgi:hypothetical protein
MNRIYSCPGCGGQNFHRVERIELDNRGRVATILADADTLTCVDCRRIVEVSDDGSIQVDRSAAETL